MQKVNGFTRELHLYQKISYGVFLSMFLVYYFVLFPLSSDTSKIAGFIIETLSAIAVVVSGYLATAIDPSDPLLKMSRRARVEGISYEPPVREIYCSTDHTYVRYGSKHCRRCNRCTEGFDHHCKWINNDIGKANYKHFFVLISSVMVFLTAYVVMSILVTINYAHDSTLLSNNVLIYQNNSGQILAALVILWIFMAPAALLLILDINLVLFHIYLKAKGLTTYQYIAAVEQRKEEKRELEEAMKILGKDKRTFLDFVLCLNKKKTEQGTTPILHDDNSTVSTSSPRPVQELSNFGEIDKKKSIDIENAHNKMCLEGDRQTQHSLEDYCGRKNIISALHNNSVIDIKSDQDTNTTASSDSVEIKPKRARNFMSSIKGMFTKKFQENVRETMSHQRENHGHGIKVEDSKGPGL